MQIIRTIVGVVILFAIFIFSVFNWKTVEVNLWENLVLETKVPVLVVIAFLIGLVPMWLYHRSVKWSLSRRVRSLENSIKSTALARRHEPEGSESMPGNVEKSGVETAQAGENRKFPDETGSDKPA